MIASRRRGRRPPDHLHRHGPESEEQAELMAKAVVGSSLVKAAMFGADANWGRVLCAMGYSKAPFDPEDVEVKFLSQAGQLLVCRQGPGRALR